MYAQHSKFIFNLNMIKITFGWHKLTELNAEENNIIYKKFMFITIKKDNATPSWL